MGCFMGCFGLSSNKKRRNSIRKILPRDQRICSYEPLLSSDPTDFSTIIDNPEKISNSNLRGEVGEEEKKVTKKTRKRVRFDLNVQTYEPIVPPRYENDCSDDEEGKGEKEKPEDLSSRSVYPSNYRYHNCVDSFEDEDEMGYGESDLEDEDYYTDDENDYEDDADDEDEEEEERDQDVTPLLNPVENLAQWKAVKARPVKVKRVMKENVEADMDDQEKPLLEIIVNTSLSNWLASPKSFHGNGSSKRSPIVDITNMENR
ncbi:hypothetical protein ISN45_Aa04g017730 [Arabidopsis thaliana x Arabidopsis arenosa]|uniref:Uncharacterized protein n=1 Tax=Arabidopsis thaliana x Arabidopsis arenosa TaxID=1240361 RepID=A0A8T2A9H6_9BRAS|nr:hypothetical protein ISN45_Aa04g017730 [Arabidopsis thaliana x Arabidopsis arenosa]